MNLRVRNHPILGPLAQGRQVTFTFDGRTFHGWEGEPIAAALTAAGIRVLRRTGKHAQPRGIFCAIGLCTDCMVTVDGVPNTRSCVTPLKAGMTIQMQSGERGRK